MQRNLFESRQARDVGIQLTSDSNADWMQSAMDAIRGLGEWTGSGEDLRHRLLDAGIGSPKKPNAWGALVNHAKRRNLLRETGRMVQMRDVKSHARRTFEYTTAPR